jgi:hypothetical protein
VAISQQNPPLSRFYGKRGFLDGEGIIHLRESQILSFPRSEPRFLLMVAFGMVVKSIAGFLTPTAVTGSRRFLATKGAMTVCDDSYE